MLLIMFLLASESIYSRCLLKELFSITIHSSHVVGVPTFFILILRAFVGHTMNSN